MSYGQLLVFQSSQCGANGVILEASGHKTTVVVTQVTGKRTVAKEIWLKGQN